VLGIGATSVAAVDGRIDGLVELRDGAAAGAVVPSTPAAPWLWLRGSDRGELVPRTSALLAAARPAFVARDIVDAFVHADSHDLSGYVDGTENPQGERARAAAIVAGRDAGLDGGSFVAVQQWQHDLATFASLSRTQRDHTIGRRLADNAEIADAPASAHVKRTAQERVSPHVYVVRRSMPWTDGQRADWSSSRSAARWRRSRRCSTRCPAARTASSTCCSRSRVRSPAARSGAHPWATAAWTCTRSASAEDRPVPAGTACATHAVQRCRRGMRRAIAR
jgi:Dyp-type peroxidase family